MEDEIVTIHVPCGLVSDIRNRNLLPDLIRMNLLQRAENDHSGSVELSKGALFFMDEMLSEEQAARGFDENYSLNDYGQYLENLLAIIEEVRLRS